MSGELERLASSCIFPGFEGPTVPDWLRRQLAEGLGGVVLYAWNVESREQLRALTDDLRSDRPDLVIAIDEEGGDVTRLEAATGSSYPGNGALGVVDDVGLTERVAALSARSLPMRGGQPRLRARRRRQHESAEPGNRNPLVRRRRPSSSRGMSPPSCAASRARGWRRARSISPVTATPPSTRTSRCRSSRARRCGARPVPRGDRGGSSVDHDRAHRRPVGR